jgi:hypothetical protein
VLKGKRYKVSVTTDFMKYKFKMEVTPQWSEIFAFGDVNNVILKSWLRARYRLKFCVVPVDCPVVVMVVRYLRVGSQP